MSVNPLRVKKLNETPYQGGTVVYRMCRDIRVHDNDALLFAQELALLQQSELVVEYVVWNYLWEGGTRRFYDWVLPSLEEVERELRNHNIPLVITLEKEKVFNSKKHPSLLHTTKAIVIDELPLHFMSKWKETFLKYHNNISLYEVDAHNCIPVWHTSTKQEFAAHTIRPKIHRLLPDFLEEYGKLRTHHENKEILKSLTPIDWKDVHSKIICNEQVTGVGDFIPGGDAAKKLLTHFLKNKLTSYDESRNAINDDGQSNLSPYIAHGNISRRRIIKELLAHTKVNIVDAFDAVKNGSNGTMGSVAAFIEECVVRAELAENYCYYNHAYDSGEGFPTWAKESLRKAKTDKREYVYSLKAFEEARTHDPLWNAAQMQMVTTGKMHGYMRMYWAKKILEWSKTPEDAMKVAVYLNDVYELDGRDPNGYVGCAWSIGGVHDRAWFPRPIFGTIRYMAESGVAKRGNVKEYITRWNK